MPSKPEGQCPASARGGPLSKGLAISGHTAWHALSALPTMMLLLLSQSIARQCILTLLPRGSTSSHPGAKVPIHLDRENDCNQHEARLRSHQGCVSTFGAWPWHLQSSTRNSAGRASVRWPTSPFPLESTNAGYCRGSHALILPLDPLTRQSPTGRTWLPCCLCELW